MATERWEIDAARSTVRFSVRHMMFAKVRGGFARWRGEIALDTESFERSSVTAEFDADSFDSGDALRDRECRGTLLFDSAKFPKLSFVSTRVSGRPEKFELEGTLGIRGVARPVRFTVKASTRGEGKRFEGKLTLRRSDFGLNFAAALETGGVLVGDEVELELDVLAARKP